MKENKITFVCFVFQVPRSHTIGDVYHLEGRGPKTPRISGNFAGSHPRVVLLHVQPVPQRFASGHQASESGSWEKCRRHARNKRRHRGKRRKRGGCQRGRAST